MSFLILGAFFHIPLIKCKCSVFQENKKEHRLKEMFPYVLPVHALLDYGNEW